MPSGRPSVEQLTSATEAEYEQFVLDHPSGLLYHSLSYRDLLVRELGCRPQYLIARDGGRVCGLMPLMRRDGDAGVVINALPYFGSHGAPLASDRAAADALLSAYADLVCADGVAAGTVVGHPFEPGAPEPVHTHVDDRVNQTTDLSRCRNHDDVLALCEASARRNVRKAQAAGVQVSRDPTAMTELARLHRENMEAMGAPAKTTAFFRSVEDIFVAGKTFDVWAARLDGEVIAALLTFTYRQTVEYFTPAVDSRFRPLQPLAAILAEAIGAAAERGVTRWNWGGTWPSQESLFRFKRKWGAAARPYRYHTQLNDPDLLGRTAADLIAAYEHFYVVPFTYLAPPEGVA
jgi:hypothetical protein